jgi:hypothetical protein
LLGLVSCSLSLVTRQEGIVPHMIEGLHVNMHTHKSLYALGTNAHTIWSLFFKPFWQSIKEHVHIRDFCHLHTCITSPLVSMKNFASTQGCLPAPSQTLLNWRMLDGNGITLQTYLYFLQIDIYFNGLC